MSGRSERRYPSSTYGLGCSQGLTGVFSVTFTRLDSTRSQAGVPISGCLSEWLKAPIACGLPQTNTMNVGLQVVTRLNVEPRRDIRTFYPRQAPPTRVRHDLGKSDLPQRLDVQLPALGMCIRHVKSSACPRAPLRCDSECAAGGLFGESSTSACIASALQRLQDCFVVAPPVMLDNQVYATIRPAPAPVRSTARGDILNALNGSFLRPCSKKTHKFHPPPLWKARHSLTPSRDRAYFYFDD
jgi:hypothetical protein